MIKLHYDRETYFIWNYISLMYSMYIVHMCVYNIYMSENWTLVSCPPTNVKSRTVGNNSVGSTKKSFPEPQNLNWRAICWNVKFLKERFLTASLPLGPEI